MPRKPNYGFEKRQKELERKTKKEEKLRRREEGGGDDAEGAPAESATEPGFDEYGRPLGMGNPGDASAAP